MIHRFLFRSLAACLFVAAAAVAQDTSTTPFGGSTGASFDERAPVDRRIHAVTVYSGQFVDGLSMTYERRNGTTQGASAQMGNTSGTTAVFDIADGDYLRRVDVWYDSSLGYLRAIRLRTALGQVQTFGSPTGTQQAFLAPAGEEIVGFVGNGTALLSALGVTHRPLLASHAFFGAGCDSTLGLVAIRYRAGSGHLFLGGATIVEITNVPVYFGIIAIGFVPYVGGVPLDGFGAPGCSLYQSLDTLVLSATEPNQTAGHTLFVPNDPAVLGAELTFQGATFSAPNGMNLATSNAMRCMVGAL